jgi:hypothetical protein
MNINSKHVAALLAASAMAFGIGARADDSLMCDHMGPNGRMSGRQMAGDPAARAEQHLAQFKTQLKITPQQEPLWHAFADKVKANAGQGMKAMREASQQQMTAPERMTRMVDLMKARASAMESVNDSFKRLYDALTPEQKATADKYHPFGDHMAQGNKRAGPRGAGMGPQGGMSGAGGPGMPGQGPASGSAPR